VGHRRLRVDANPVLLLAGAACVLVAIVGLFVRSSPTLSGAFVVAGTVMLILSVFKPRVDDSVGDHRAAVADLDLAQLERSARAAEAQIASGHLESADLVTPGTDTTMPIRAFVAKTAVRRLRGTDDEVVNALTQELEALPTLEETSRIAPIEGLPAGYRCLTLPSGYMVLYRRLTPVEVNQATGAYTDEDAYLVADVRPLIDSPKG
jgi:hypothetical protein